MLHLTEENNYLIDWSAHFLMLICPLLDFSDNTKLFFQLRRKKDNKDNKQIQGR